MSKRHAHESIEELKRTIQIYLKENDNLMVLVNLTKYGTLSNQNKEYEDKFIAIAQEIWNAYDNKRLKEKEEEKSLNFIEWINSNIKKGAFNRDIEQLDSLQWCFSILQERGPMKTKERTD